MNRVIDLSNYPTFNAINLLVDPGYDRADHVIPNCVAVILGWTLESGKLAHNVLHGRVTGSFSPTTTIANALMTGLTTGAAWTAFALTLAPTTLFSGIFLRDLRVANQPLIPTSLGPGVGTGTGESLPNEVAACVTLRTALAGRSARGRIYLPGFTVGTTAAGNVMSTALVTAINNWAGTIPSVFAGQGLTFALGLPHRLAYTSLAGTPHPERLATTLDITSQVLRDNHWDSQRRRGLK